MDTESFRFQNPHARVFRLARYNNCLTNSYVIQRNANFITISNSCFVFFLYQKTLTVTNLSGTAAAELIIYYENIKVLCSSQISLCHKAFAHLAI